MIATFVEQARRDGYAEVVDIAVEIGDEVRHFGLVEFAQRLGFEVL